MPNIRGSTGYGPQLRMANYGDLGGADFQDLLAATKYVIAQNIADEKKLGIFGWSYGGFLCELAATQTQVFKAAVCGAAISNWTSHDTTSDFKAYTSGYFGEKYSRDFSKSNILIERSPALNIKYTNTPILLLHGTKDRAVDFEQALEFFWALKNKNATISLAAFPNEEHAFHNPESITQAARLIEEWFRKYLLAQPQQEKTVPGPR